MDPLLFARLDARGAPGRVRVRLGRRHPRRAVPGGQGADHRPAHPGHGRDRARGLPALATRCCPRARSASGTATTPPASKDEPVIEVEGIYHRNDPIILGMPPNKPPWEPMRYREYLRSALLLRNMKAAGVPGVVGRDVLRLRRQPAVHGRVDPAALRRPRPPGDARRRDVPCRARTWAGSSSWSRTTSTSRTSRRSCGPWSPAATRSARSTSSSAPGPGRSTRPSTPTRRGSTSACCTTQPGPGSGATSSRRPSVPTPRRSVRRAEKWGWVLDPTATPPAG